jgi:hypothetical protein
MMPQTSQGNPSTIVRRRAAIFAADGTVITLFSWAGLLRLIVGAGLRTARHSQSWSFSELDDHLLRDIGTTRLAAEIAGARPFCRHD